MLFRTWEFFFEQPIDKFPNSYHQWKEIIKDFINDSEWFEVYDLLCVMIQYWPSDYDLSKKINLINQYLEQYNSGYRIINKFITQITNDIEINTINTALSDDNLHHSIKIQLNESLEKMSRFEKPDFRGSVKDSISALESLLRFITKDDSIELSRALKFLEEKSEINLHPALKESFIKLYAWTSDADGIRHSLMDYPKLGLPEARFMLVSCSAFINLISDKYRAEIK